MDPELLELVARLNGEGEPLSDEELAGLRSRVSAILGEINRDAPTDADLQVASEGAGVIRVVDTEVATRATSAAERADRLAAELDGLELPEVVDETAEGEQEEEAPAEEPVAEVPADEPPAETEAVDEQVPVAAAATPFRLPSITHLASRTPRRSKPVPTATEASTQTRRPSLIASATLPGIGAGEKVEPQRWLESVVRMWGGMKDARPPEGEEKIYLGKMKYEYPEDRFLTGGSDDEYKLNRAAKEDAPLIASGGICGPVAADYSLSTIASAVRPVRDSLTQFGANRGGVRFVLPHTLAAVNADGPNAIWTQATDAAPGNSVKQKATYVCQTPQEVYVDAITSIVQIGNFQQRYFPEQVDQYMATVDADHARLAESTLLGRMLTDSKLVTGAINILGCASDYFAHLDLALARFRYTHRTLPDGPLQLWYPEWFEDELRADFARELPGNSGGRSERMAVTDAEIDNFFAVRNVQRVKYLDNPTGANPAQSWGIQNAGEILPWPSKVLSILSHPGAHNFLDGGEFNLGMYRDSTLNSTNSLQIFSESMERSVFRGHESIALMLDVCASGARAGTADSSTLCNATGS